MAERGSEARGRGDGQAVHRGEGLRPGVRRSPLKRLVQREIENVLALSLLEGRFHDGDTIAIGAGDEGLDIR